MPQQPAGDAPSLPGFCDSEAYFCGAAERRVATFGDDAFVASAWHGGHQSHMVPKPDFVEPTQVVLAETPFRVKEAHANRLRLEMKKGFDKTLPVVRVHGPDGHLVAVLQCFLGEIGRYIRHVSPSDTMAAEA